MLRKVQEYPRAFHMLRRVRLLTRYYLGITYDPNYAYVRHLPNGCTILDVGANAGQSALEFARLRPDANVVSFEANPDNLTDLALVRRVLGQQFAFHHVALSDQCGSGRLYVPIVGNTAVPGEASLQPELFAEFPNVVDYPVPLRTLDSYELAPHFVKIDVQGSELNVLRGMARTLERYRPVLLIEPGASFEEVRQFLDNAGYSSYAYDVSADRMLTLDANRGDFFAMYGK
jgi:FkbM family methyltransferase